MGQPPDGASMAPLLDALIEHVPPPPSARLQGEVVCLFVLSSCCLHHFLHASRMGALFG
jgi:hypothetical protein